MVPRSQPAQIAAAPDPRRVGELLEISRRTLRLVWQTSPRLTMTIAGLTLVLGLLPAATAYTGKLIVDGVVEALRTGSESARWDTLFFIGLEAVLMILLAGCQRALNVSQSLLRALLGQRVNVMILDKARTLELAQFEDAEFYDKLTRARRGASTRPLGLVNRIFSLLRHIISLVSYGGLLLGFSGWAVAVLIVAGLPAFVVEARFSNEAFRLFQRRSQESRQQMYLEMVMAREDYVKEVKLFQLAPTLLQRYQAIFETVYGENRALVLRRGLWSVLLGALSTAALYGAYVWVVISALDGMISLGDMTMYMVLFRQGQSAFSMSLTSVGLMYEDNLYLSNLYEYLEQPSATRSGSATSGPDPGDGLRFERVSFRYPGAESLALENLSLHIKPGQSLAIVGQNGAGKTTLIKLLTRLYEPTAGQILLDGRPLPEWDIATLQKRIGVIFQDFNQYQLKVGENIGVGDVDHLDNELRQRNAAAQGLADAFIEPMPKGYQTQLGRWFRDGRELSGGQWQKVALARAFMRQDADILILDEPTAAIDAEAEAAIFEQFRHILGGQMAILISHRFSTVRMADQIVVMQEGRVIEEGTHEELMTLGGHYARLFTLQAAGYQ